MNLDYDSLKGDINDYDDNMKRENKNINMEIFNKEKTYDTIVREDSELNKRYSTSIGNAIIQPIYAAPINSFENDNYSSPDPINNNIQPLYGVRLDK